MLFRVLRFLGYLTGVLGLAFVFFVANPLHANFEVCSPVSGEASVWYDLEPLYGHSREDVEVGCQVWHFDILSTENPSLTLSLPLSPGTYQIKSAWVQALFLPVESPLSSLVAWKNIHSLKETPDGLEVVTKAGSSAPELIFTLGRPRLLLAMHAAASLAVALFSVLLGWFLRFLLVERRGVFHRVEVFLRRIWRGDFSLGRELGLYILLGMGLHLYAFTQFPLFIDAEMAAMRQDATVWLAEDRWVAWLLEKFVFSQPVMPFLPVLLLLLALSFSYALILRIHSLPRDWRSYLLFPVLAVYPVWAFWATFPANLPSISVGLACASLAAWLFVHFSPQQGRLGGWSLLGQAALLTIALGAYQTLLFWYVALVLGAMLWRWERVHPTKKDFLFFWVSVGLAVLLHFLLNAVLRFIFPFPEISRGYLQTFYQMDALLSSPMQVFSNAFLFEMRSYYGGQDSKYGISISALAAAFFVAVFWGIFRSALWTPQKKFGYWFLFVVWLSSPFWLNLLSARENATRSFLSLAYITWFFAALPTYSRRYSARMVGIVLSLALAGQFLQANYLSSSLSFLTQQQDLHLAHSIYEQMGAIQTDDPDEGVWLVDVYGGFRASLPYPAPWSGTQGSSFFSFSWTTPGSVRAVQYMRLLGYPNLQPVSPAQAKSLIPFFQSMPAYPAAGYIRLVDGIYLIKLGEAPDPWHKP